MPASDGSARPADATPSAQKSAAPRPLNLANPLQVISEQLADVTSFRLFERETERAARSRLALSRTTFFKDAIRVRGSVLRRIWVSVLCITLYAAAIALADIHYGMRWQMSNSIIAPLSVVLGLLIVFRNNSSYDRWYEGRKDFQGAMSDVRNLARALWIQVDCEAGEKMEALKKRAAEEDHNWDAVRGLREQRLTRKRRAVRLLVCFLYAMKVGRDEAV